MPSKVSWTTGWRRPTRWLKLQVIFRKRATNYRALLRKMTYTDKASSASTPPCSELGHHSLARSLFRSLPLSPYSVTLFLCLSRCRLHLLALSRPRSHSPSLTLSDSLAVSVRLCVSVCVCLCVSVCVCLCLSVSLALSLTFRTLS